MDDLLLRLDEAKTAYRPKLQQSFKRRFVDVLLAELSDPLLALLEREAGGLTRRDEGSAAPALNREQSLDPEGPRVERVGQLEAQVSALRARVISGLLRKRARKSCGSSLEDAPVSNERDVKHEEESAEEEEQMRAKQLVELLQRKRRLQERVNSWQSELEGLLQEHQHLCDIVKQQQ
eukprot:TRINITY_DN13698_c0_g1_i1.p1 TRINITY_DN13698_c0_g1~~TRINITY_DN13698_c0_g1_i1.p1  ORF type:complete len:196 (-),score=68.35 TRINITY_DN13698_c0_g1_i1:110-643(-)